MFFEVFQLFFLLYLYNLFFELENKFTKCQQNESEYSMIELIQSNNNLTNEYNQLYKQMQMCIQKQETVESINNSFSNKLIEVVDSIHDLQNTLKIKNNIDIFEIHESTINELNDKCDILFKIQTELICNNHTLTNEIDKTTQLIYTQKQIIMNDINSNMSNLFNMIKYNLENKQKIKNI